MLESLRLLDQAWDDGLSGALKTLRLDWERRISETALLIKGHARGLSRILRGGEYSRFLVQRSIWGSIMESVRTEACGCLQEEDGRDREEGPCFHQVFIQAQGL